ncbi:MAG: hypothetical protein U0176_10275 [Bacteroidia bacterium]
MESVFIVHHSYEQGDCEETKLIGIYSSRLKAEEAVERLRLQPGFKRMPEHFSIDCYQLDEDHWTEGFASSIGLHVPDYEGNWIVVEASLVEGDIYQIFELYTPELLGEFKHGDTVRAEYREVEGGWYAVERVILPAET